MMGYDEMCLFIPAIFSNHPLKGIFGLQFTIVCPKPTAVQTSLGVGHYLGSNLNENALKQREILKQ